LGLRFRRGSKGASRAVDIPLVGVVSMEPASEPVAPAAGESSIAPAEEEAAPPRPRRTPRKRVVAVQQEGETAESPNPEAAPVKRPRSRPRKKVE
jgi:hypothetical protein